MKINILSLFLPFFEVFFEQSIIKRAKDSGIIDVKLYNIRDYGLGPRAQVDDKPFGGGVGMLLRVEPIINCLESIDKTRLGKVIMLCPRGESFNQKMAKETAVEPAITLICGRYEGFDHRIEQFIDQKISIGPYVLNGGEVAAMALLEASLRLVPGVVGNAESTLDESHDGYLEYPQYTRPADFRGMKVPDVLINGDHKKIENWKQTHKEFKQTHKEFNVNGK